MPTRNFFAYADLNELNVAMFVEVTQRLYDSEPRYKKVSAPIVYTGGTWGFAYASAKDVS